MCFFHSVLKGRTKVTSHKKRQELGVGHMPDHGFNEHWPRAQTLGTNTCFRGKLTEGKTRQGK